MTGMLDEIIKQSGYNVMNADCGNFQEMSLRNECFSKIREFMTTRSNTQSGSTATVQQDDFMTWRRYLKFGDGQVPPEPGPYQILFWVDMPGPADEEERRSTPAPKSMPRRPSHNSHFEMHKSWRLLSCGHVGGVNGI